jgi:hypothetical protein
MSSDRKGEFKILVYSYVSDSPSIHLAVKVAGSLAELVQVRFSVPIYS